MTAITGAGSALAISAATPATFDAAGYGALTYTVIGGIDKLGALGGTFTKVEFQALSGQKDKLKGSFDSGSLNPTIAVNSDDAGQALLATASDDRTQKLYAFKVTKPDGAIRYFRGRVFGMAETIDGADSVITAAPEIGICTDIVSVDAP